jgi:hypothetical protein
MQSHGLVDRMQSHGLVDRMQSHGLVDRMQSHVLEDRLQSFLKIYRIPVQVVLWRSGGGLQPCLQECA